MTEHRPTGIVYHRIGLTVKSDLREKDVTVSRIIRILEDVGAHVCVDAKRAEGIGACTGLPALRTARTIDLLVIIGGDGTIFRAIREMPDLRVPILSVNRGAVGFLAETNVDEAPKVIPRLLCGEGAIEERRLLTVLVRRGRKTVFEGCALNEAVIAQGAIARLIDLHTCVGGEELTTFHADGLILATPTGSTAYSLSAGGPIAHPKLPAIILTPINPHSFTQKPIVLPGDQEITVEVLKKAMKFLDSEIGLTLDGQVYFPLEAFDRVIVRMGRKVVKFLRRRQDTFFSTLRAKLRWGE